MLITSAILYADKPIKYQMLEFVFYFSFVLCYHYNQKRGCVYGNNIWFGAD